MAPQPLITHGSATTVVRRQRLIARLHELVHRRLTMVVAPAGYGKTTLLSDFVADCAAARLPMAVCWYTAAPWDADVTLLLRGLSRAIQAGRAGFGERTLRLLQGASAGPSPAGSEALVASALSVLLDELHEHVSDDVLLVVDDYHLIDGSEPARGALETLLERMPGHVRVVLLSRSVPGLDTGRLVMAGEVGGLGPRELAFTAEELAQVIRERYGVEPDPEVVEQVYRHTEGWIAGLVLAAATPVEQPARAWSAALLATLTHGWNSGQLLHDYLAGQLLRRQTPDDQELLLAAALPNVWQPHELDQVLQRPGSAAALARLERAGVPLIPLENRSGVYRMHALLQQSLRAHLEQTDRRRYEGLHRHWGDLAQQRGDDAEAMTHYLAGRLYERAARLLERIGERSIDSGRRRLVEEWLEQLPAGLLSRRPRVALCAGRLAIAQGNRALAVEQARQAGFAAQRARDSVAAARALLLEAMATVGSGRTEEGLRLCQLALENRTVQRYKPLLAEAYRSLSIAESIRGFPALALEHMQQALALYERAGQQWDVAVALTSLGAAHEQLGQAEQALWCQTRALALRRELDDLAGVGRTLNNIALLHFYRGAYGEAEAMLQEAMALAEKTGNSRLQAAAQVNLGDLACARQRPAQAEGCYRLALEAARAAGDALWQGYALIGLAAAALLAGDSARATAVARQALDLAERCGLLEVHGHASALLGAASLLEGRRREASALLEGARQVAQETANAALRVRVYLWSGLTAYQQKRWGESLACVQVAAEASRGLGGPGLVTREGAALVPLLQMAASRGVATELLARALDGLDAAAAGAVREAAAPLPATSVLPTVKLRLLGSFAGTVAGQPLEGDLAPRSRLRELLAYLAVHREGRRREEIGADLWPDAGPGQDVTLTHTTLHRLRQAIFPELIVGDGSGATGVYRINPEVHLDLDVARFERRLHAAGQPGISQAERRAHLAAAVAEYGGLFFPECGAEWGVVIRSRLERRYALALAQLVDADWAVGDYRACLAWCERLLEVEAADEAVHCRVLECYARLGEPLAGVLHYRRYARELAEQEHGGPSTRVAGIVRHLEAALTASSATVASPPGRPTFGGDPGGAKRR
ncbi:MAG TPA: tetratricopeptide repeat protein [Chloroflexota bacterium]|nr:tetratricopeptide repeat protein [Chloroflexota bacterium]